MAETRPKIAVHGVLVVDKPRGPTSHDVVMRVRKLLKSRAVGHAGTLDPMATGVLVVAVGDATKLVPWLTAADKAYLATIRLGVGTATLDAEGDETGRAPIPADIIAWARAWSGPASAADAAAHVRANSSTRSDEAAEPDAGGAVPAPLVAERDRREPVGGAVPARLVRALAAERERRAQVPPAFSAIKVDGVRAHERARAGEDVALAARPVEVRRLELRGARVVDGGQAPAENGAPGQEPVELVELDVEVHAAKGYFVRALAHDLAAGIGTLGHLTALRRIQSGAFRIEDAVALDAVTPASLLTLDDAAQKALPVTILDADGVKAAGFGQRIAPAQMRDVHAGPSAWVDEALRLVAVGECGADGFGQVLRGFPR